MRTASAVLTWVLACTPGIVGAGDKPPVPSYTNDDLDRLSSRRGETGALSTPAFAPRPEAEARATGPRHDEAYWRREAERLHDRLRSLRQRATEIQIRLANPPHRAQGKSGRGSSSTSSDPTPALKARLAAIEEEIRDREERFWDRARREGALPGWLR